MKQVNKHAFPGTVKFLETLAIVGEREASLASITAKYARVARFGREREETEASRGAREKTMWLGRVLTV